MSEWVTDKHSQWSDSGPIKTLCAMTLTNLTMLIATLTIYFEIWTPDLCQIMCFFLQITILLRMFCLGSQRSRLISITEVDLHFTGERLFVTLLHIHHSTAPRPSFNTDGKEVVWESYWETWWPGAASSRGRSRVGRGYRGGGRGRKARSKGSPSCPQAVSEIRRVRLPSWNLPTLKLVSFVNICLWNC